MPGESNSNSKGRFNGKDDISIIDGTSDNDRLNGYDDDAYIFGYGGEGDDKLKGGLGDTMTGGQGDDLFHLKAHVGGDDTAVVTDFTQGEDQLKLAGRAKKVFLHEHEDGVLLAADRAGKKAFAILEGVSTALTQADFTNQGLNIVDLTGTETSVITLEVV